MGNPAQHRSLPASGGHGHDLLGFVDVERAEEEGMGEAEDRGEGAGRQGQREQSRQRECRAAAEAAKRVAQVLERGFEHPDAAKQNADAQGLAAPLQREYAL